MNDLEDRLRTSLRESADTLPASPDARADLERRLTGRRRRVPVAVVAAAAAVVVAAVAVPVALSRDDERLYPPVATSAPATTSPQVTTGPGGIMFYDLAPAVLGRFTEDGAELDVELLFGQYVDESEVYCIAKTRPGGSGIQDEVCERVPVWPVGPTPGMLVLGKELYGDGTPVMDTGPLSDLMLFVTAPQVTRLDVNRHDGAPVEVREVGRMEGAAFFLADFDGPKGGKEYTAWDAAGNVVESAIE